MFVCVDVHYYDDNGVASCVVFRDWTDDCGVQEVVKHLRKVRDYMPGFFYKRELPCIMGVLSKAQGPIHAVVIDGYVWLGKEIPGLGAHLYDKLGGTCTVIGVAKSRFKGNSFAKPIFRGRSKRPLYITAAGIASQIAAQHIQQMHGKFRIPTLLKRVDSLARTSLTEQGAKKIN